MLSEQKEEYPTMKMHRLTLSSRGPEVQELRERVEILERELAKVTAELAKQATPPRPAWVRYSSPIDPDSPVDVEEMPTAQLAVVPDPEFARITIDQHNYVRVYRPNGHLHVNYTGPLWAVLYAILEKCGAKRWEAVYTTPRGESLTASDPIIASLPRKDPETPFPAALMPDTSRSLV